MSITLLTVFTVAEIVILVAILGGFLLVVAQDLRSIVTTLAEVAWGARAVERQLKAVPSNIGHINAGLTDAAAVLPGLSDQVDRMTGRRS
jgi:hypothetical protein